MNEFINKYIYQPSYIGLSSFFVANLIFNKINREKCLLCAGRFFTAKFWIIFWTTNCVIYNIIN